MTSAIACARGHVMPVEEKEAYRIDCQRKVFKPLLLQELQTINPESEILQGFKLPDSRLDPLLNIQIRIISQRPDSAFDAHGLQFPRTSLRIPSVVTLFNPRETVYCPYAHNADTMVHV